MLEELQRRNYSEATTRYYIRKVEAFARYFQCSPDRLGPQHIREYQAHLFAKRKLSPGTVTTHLCALRFFYIQTLKKPWSIADTPYPKKAHRLPTILSQEEVTQLIDAALTPFHHTLLMTLYGSGVRNAELTHLKVTDIDSQRMVIHVQGGKGRQDRDVMLSPVLLDELRAHWRRLRKKSGTWPTNNEQKLMTLSLDEFLSRFLLYLLPKGFVRIRNFGFLANRRRATLLPLCFHLLGSTQPTEQELSTGHDVNDLRLCPKCGGPMMVIERLTAAEIQLRSPPTLVAVAA